MDPLKNWTTLNKTLMSCGERKAQDLLDTELKGKRRPTFLRRIHSRLNYLRAMRERKSLERKGKPAK